MSEHFRMIKGNCRDTILSTVPSTVIRLYIIHCANVRGTPKGKSNPHFQRTCNSVYSFPALFLFSLSKNFC